MHVEVQIALNFLISFLYNKLPRRRVNQFGEELGLALEAKFAGHWYDENPFKGSAFRCIKTALPLDPVFEVAAREAGMDLIDISDNLPADLAIWIDPGEVTYRMNETDPVKVLYSEREQIGGSNGPQGSLCNGSVGSQSGSESGGEGGSPNKAISPAASQPRTELTRTFNPDAQCFKPVESVVSQMNALSLSMANHQSSGQHGVNGQQEGNAFGRIISGNSGNRSFPANTHNPLGAIVGQPPVTTTPPAGPGAPIYGKGANSASSQIMTAGAFAKTKFGSIKPKQTSKRSSRMSPTEFSNYIKSKQMQQNGGQCESLLNGTHHHHNHGHGNSNAMPLIGNNAGNGHVGSAIFGRSASVPSYGPNFNCAMNGSVSRCLSPTNGFNGVPTGRRPVTGSSSVTTSAADYFANHCAGQVSHMPQNGFNADVNVSSQQFADRRGRDIFSSGKPQNVRSPGYAGGNSQSSQVDYLFSPQPDRSPASDLGTITIKDFMSLVRDMNEPYLEASTGVDDMCGPNGNNGFNGSKGFSAFDSISSNIGNEIDSILGSRIDLPLLGSLSGPSPLSSPVLSSSFANSSTGEINNNNLGGHDSLFGGSLLGTGGRLSAFDSIFSTDSALPPLCSSLGMSSGDSNLGMMGSSRGHLDSDLSSTVSSETSGSPPSTAGNQGNGSQGNGFQSQLLVAN